MLQTNYKPRLLIIDDSQLQLNILSDALEDSYEIHTAVNGREGLEFLATQKVDLILSDIIMPELDGIQFYQKLLENKATQKIPVIFISSVSDVDSKVKLFKLGAFDYITKPFDLNEVKVRLAGHSQRILQQRELEFSLWSLNQRLATQTQEVDAIYDLFYGTIVNIALAKSKETGFHLVRTKYYLGLLLKKYLQLYPNPPSLEEKTTELIVEHMMQAATTHDIGKVGIPDQILMKPGRLTSEEYEIMKTHTLIGYDMLAAKENIFINNTVLHYAKVIVRNHHERWDGFGYPDGLAGEQIPLPARIMSIADVYDALVSKRIYKEAISHEAAVKIILNESGKNFDPILVDIFLNEHHVFRKISIEYQDKE